MKVAAVIGLSIVMSGVCDANAATTSPVTRTISDTAPASLNAAEQMSFPQFNPSLGTLTSVDFSLNSSINGASPGFLGASIFPISNSSITPIDTTTNNGPFDFTDLTGLVGGLTTADYTGGGSIAVFADLRNAPGGTTVVTWTGGLTLMYDYTPAVSTTPLPATLPLFATGLGGLGLLGWRRKRKSRADILAM